MNIALYTRNFVGSELKTPCDHMRANAMINAHHDTRGMSVLIYNANYFLKEARHQDLYYILSLWAVEPIKRNPVKFKKYSESGKKALYDRIEILRKEFYMAPHIHDCFVDQAIEHMMIAIDNEMSLLCPDLRQSYRMRYA